MGDRKNCSTLYNCCHAIDSRQEIAGMTTELGCRARSPNAPLFFPDCSENSPYNGEQSEGHATVHTTWNSPYMSLQYPLPLQVCKACRERFVTVPPGRRATTPCTPASGGQEQCGCRARSPNAPLFFPDCSGNSPYNVEQSLQYPLPPQACKACRERFETVPYGEQCLQRRTV